MIGWPFNLWLLRIAGLSIFMGFLMLFVGSIYLGIWNIKNKWGKNWDEVYGSIMLIFFIVGAMLIVMLFAV